MIYKLPPRFYEDHVERDCLAGVVLRESRGAVYVDLDEPALADLRSDAVYYAGLGPEAGFGGIEDPWGQGIIVSARATLKALDKGPIVKVPKAAPPRRPRVVKETMASYPKPCEVCGQTTHRRLTGDHAVCLGHLAAVATDILGKPAVKTRPRTWEHAKA